jgi:DNA polymerase III epsilon subunit-like protein
MNYYTIPKLKTYLLKQSKNSQMREEIKVALSIPKLMDITINEKHSIAIGKNVFAFSEDLLNKMFKNIDIEIPIFFATKPEYIKDEVVFENKADFFKNLNQSRKQKNTMIAFDKDIRKKESSKSRNLSKINQSTNLIEKYKKLLEEGGNGLLFDIECNERNQRQILEIGFVKFNKKGEIQKRHLIVEENYNIRNGKYVEDNKDNFNYGKSERKSLNEILQIIEKELNESDFIIGHGISNDISFLNKGGLSVNYTKPILNSLKMTYFINKGAELGIKRALENLDIKGDNLHNAGNDAVLNYEIIKEIIRNYDLKNLLKEKLKQPEELINKHPRKLKI